MDRRRFLDRALKLSAAGLLVPSTLRRGFLEPGRAWAGGGGAGAPFAGRILVLINLNGGNDGLNTIIPYNDPQYSAVRPSLAMSPAEVEVIEPGLGVGLHPSMTPLVPLYAEGKMAIVQGVGYPNMNLSHFRGTDIWFSGSSDETVLQTGWLARHIERVFTDFPATLPASPFGLQQSLAHRIPLQGERGVTGVVVDNPDSFYYLVDANYTGEYDDTVPDTRGGDELSFLREIDAASFEYAGAIQAAANAGSTTVAYPSTNLGFQLEIVAKLISGGLATPVFLTSEYGFDTHAAQSDAHAGLLSSLAGAVMAFITDLRNQGLSERVLLVTQSEFGRRVEENGSNGTDHGTAAPMMLFGDPVTGGVFGSNPDLVNLDPNNNLFIQHDYRSVYQTVLQNHFGASAADAQEVLFGDFGTLPLMNVAASADPAPLSTRVDRLHAIQPNPIRPGVSGVPVRFDLATPQRVRIEVFDVRGRQVADLGNRRFPAGEHRLDWNVADQRSGTYFVRMATATWQRSVKATLLP